jgi:hypothetical protein
MTGYCCNLGNFFAIIPGLRDKHAIRAVPIRISTVQALRF